MKMDLRDVRISFFLSVCSSVALVQLAVIIILPAQVLIFSQEGFCHAKLIKVRVFL
jgi:hypothetical protein